MLLYIGQKIIRQIIEESNNNLLYSVPYHPETNAIEEFFNQLKHYIKKRKSKYIRRYRKSNKRYNNYQNKARTFNKLSKT